MTLSSLQNHIYHIMTHVVLNMQYIVYNHMQRKFSLFTIHFQPLQLTNMSMLIESDWGDLECVLWHSKTGVLEHWYRQQGGPGNPWYRTATITSNATGPGCLIQSTPIAPNDHGDFQVVVLESNNLISYWRDNSNGSDQTWYQGPVVSNKATGAGSMIQSTYGTPDNPGNFEVVVPEGRNLVHYSRDNSQKSTPWSGPTITWLFWLCCFDPEYLWNT
jgi:hypothetical protein